MWPGVRTRTIGVPQGLHPLFHGLEIARATPPAPPAVQYLFALILFTARFDLSFPLDFFIPATAFCHMNLLVTGPMGFGQL